MPLSGNLEDFEITDVLQVIHLSKKDGVLHLFSLNGEAMMYFKNGILLHAEMENTDGMKAVKKIITTKKGTFKFVPGENLDKTSIQMPIQNVIIEAARQIDEWKQIENVIPSGNVVVDFVEEPDESNIELDSMEWKVLAAVNGERTVEELASNLGMEEFAVAKVIYGLISSGLLKVKKVIKKEKEEKENEGKRGGFFRRRR